MQSKLNTANPPLISPSFTASLLVHFFLLSLVVLPAIFNPKKTSENVQVTIIDKPVSLEKAAPQIARVRSEDQKKLKPKGKAVFGASKQSQVTNAETGIEVKAGNTLLKTPDAVILEPKDEGYSPPVEEYLVSAMPVILSEVRIPYPPEARKKGIQGRVEMEIVVDSNGIVRESKLIGGPGEGLNEAALLAVKSFRFKPALVEEKPVTVRIRYAYRFILEK